MKSCVFVILFIVSDVTARIVTTEEVEYLFQRAMKDQLTPAENKTLETLFSLWHVNRRRSFITDIRATVDCVICKSAFSALFSTVRSGRMYNIARTLTRMCSDLNYESHHVCKGAVELNLPIIAYIILTTPEATPEAFCSLSLQYKYDDSSCSFEDPRFDWTVKLPESPEFDGDLTIRARSRLRKPRTPFERPLKIVLLSDAHLDPLYEPYGVVHCGEPTCCRTGQKPSTDSSYRPTFRARPPPSTTDEDDNEDLLERSIIKKKNGEVSFNLSVITNHRRSATVDRLVDWVSSTEVAGYWGDYRGCDTPLWAFDDLVKNIARSHENIDVVYYLGDSIDHGVWQTSKSLVLEMHEYVVTKFREKFGDDVPVMPAIGNHDSHPSNQFAPASVRGNMNSSWFYDVLAQQWGYYLNDDALNSLRIRGGYSQRIRPGLRVISINNNVAFNHNWWLIYDPQDQKTHLDYLVLELYKAERAGDKVHLLLHIPPGSTELCPTWRREYARVVRRFASTIAAEFNGHSHGDSFKVYQNEHGIPSSVAWTAGSITPYKDNNMNYKIVLVDKTSYAPINMATFTFNLSEANQNPGLKPRWFKLYDMRTAYELPNLHPATMGNLVRSMASDKKDLLDIYIALHSKGRYDDLTDCDKECRLKMLCDIVTTEPENIRTCNEVIQVYNANAREREGGGGLLTSFSDVWEGLQHMLVGK